MRSRESVFCFVSLATLLVLALPLHTTPLQFSSPVVAGSDRQQEDADRDSWQKPDEVIEALDLRGGEVVADLGAGSGYFTLRLAQAVGSEGRVYAVDVNPTMLEEIERRAAEEQLDNIETILADADDPKLGTSSVDVIFICNTLHHIAQRGRYYQLLARALRPGGRFVDIDFHRRRLPVGPPVEMKIAREAMIKEAERAGFRLVKEHVFLPYQYFLVFERAEVSSVGGWLSMEAAIWGTMADVSCGSVVLP